MKKIGLHVLVGPMHTDDSIIQQVRKIEGDLKRISNAEYYEGETNNVDIVLFIVASGGTASLFKDLVRDIDAPIILVPIQIANALSASLEMRSYMNINNMENYIIIENSVAVPQQLETLINNRKQTNKSTTIRLGLIGEPSSWLISAFYDEKILEKLLSIETVHIDINTINETADINDETKIVELAETKLRESFNPIEIRKALRVYMALKDIVKTHNLDGFTLRCFDLLESLNTTGCLALSLLNDEGILAGCEGDFPSLVSMAILSRVTKQTFFQCNPSRINLEEKELVLAHCTVPMTMVHDYTYDTHYESGIGIAINGFFADDEYTVFKISGDLKRYILFKGRKIDMQHDNQLCRTQIKLNVEEGLERLLDKPIGNHVILVQGNYVSKISSYLEKLI